MSCAIPSRKRTHIPPLGKENHLQMYLLEEISWFPGGYFYQLLQVRFTEKYRLPSRVFFPRHTDPSGPLGIDGSQQYEEMGDMVKPMCSGNVFGVVMKMIL